MTSFQKAALIVAAILGLAAGLRAAFDVPSLSDARSQLHAAQAAAAVASHRADSAIRLSDTLRLAASRAESARAAAQQRATELEHRAAAHDTVFRVEMAHAPDTCTDVVQAALVALAGKDSVITELTLSDHNALLAEEANGTRADSLQAALQNLQGATTGLSAAATKLEHDASPSFLSHLKNLVPRFGVGESAGFDAAGKPHLTTGVTLGWNF